MNRTVILFTIMLLFSLTASAQSFNKQLEKRAKAGDVQAQYEMGKIYQGDKDKKALKWFQKAADQGHAKACYEIALLSIKGVSKDDPSVWLLKAVENGNDDLKMEVVDRFLSFNQFHQTVIACDILYSMAENGDDDMKMIVVDKFVSINQSDKAFLLLKKMADEGNNSIKMKVVDKFVSLNRIDIASTLLNDMAEKGPDNVKMMVIDKFVSINEKQKALYVLKALSEHSILYPKEDLAIKSIKIGDKDFGLSLLKQLAIEGGEEGKLALVRKMIDSEMETEAITMLEDIAATGDGNVKLNVSDVFSRLGNKYVLHRDNWLQKAAYDLIPEAMFKLGMKAYYGELFTENGFVKDKDLGKDWLKKAADLGYDPANNLLAEILQEEGEDSQINDNIMAKQKGRQSDSNSLAKLIINKTYVCEDVRDESDMSHILVVAGVKKHETYKFLPNNKLIRTKKLIIPSNEAANSDLVWRYKNAYDGTEELYYSVENNKITIPLNNTSLAPLTMNIGYNGGYLEYTSHYTGNIKIKDGTNSALSKPKGNSWVGRIYRQEKMKVINKEMAKLYAKDDIRVNLGFQIEFVSDNELVLQMFVKLEYTNPNYRNEINNMLGDHQENMPPDTYTYTIQKGIVKTNKSDFIIKIQNGGASLFVNMENCFQGVLKRIR